jgi:transposase
MNQLREVLSQYWLNIQGSLFPWLKEELGELTEKQQQLVMTLELVRLEEFLGMTYGLPGRPPADRAAIARAFVAKMVYDMPTTRVLIDRLESDQQLRRICGWERKSDIPEEWTFSRAFAEFAESRLAERVHEALIHKSYAGEIVGHICRDSTAIEAREKPVKKETKDPQEKAPKKRGRPKKGEERTKEPTRLERQIAGMSLPEMLEDLPKACDVGTKQNSKGYKSSWNGYKLHIDAADGGIPISCILTSASSHDSQSAIPLATMTNRRVTNCYDLMDSAYDAPQIHDYSRQLDHVPLIDIHPRRNKALKEELANESKRRKAVNYQTAEEQRYNERSTVERVNGRLKDEFGGRRVRVRGHAKVMCHLMFGILVLTADQLLRFVT